MTNASQAGFTLLEVLVALAVTGLVLVALTQGVQFGMRAWQTTERQTAAQEELRAADRTLRRLVERTILGDWVKYRGPVLGSEAALDLLTSLPPHPGAPPDGTVDAKLEVDARHRLLLLWVPMPHAAWIGPPPPPETAVLLTGVARLELAYWQSPPNGSGGWLRQWTMAQPPDLVRMHIVFADAADRHWPDIIAAPLLERTPL
jgi:general secretion pathway protein J